MQIGTIFYLEKKHKNNPAAFMVGRRREEPSTEKVSMERLIVERGK